jgi:hypothetical protein
VGCFFDALDAQACIINMAKQLRPMPMQDVSAGFPVWAPRIQPSFVVWLFLKLHLFIRAQQTAPK